MDVRSPVQGRVLEVAVSPGQYVVEGEELLIIESKKMEVPVDAPIAGTIVGILLGPGEPVVEGAVVVVLA